MAAKKEPVFCLFCEKNAGNGCNCIKVVQTTEALIYRLDAEIERQRVRYKFPQWFDRETVIAEGKRLRERRNELDKS